MKNQLLLNTTFFTINAPFSILYISDASKNFSYI